MAGSSGHSHRYRGGQRPEMAIASPWSIAQFTILSGALFWLLMMAVHELGHCLHAWATGGRVVRVVLHPLQFSRTDVVPNPSPAAVAWGGVIWGTLIPVVVWLGAAAMRMRISPWLRAFAGFCAVANGVYLAAGVVIPAGDTEDLLRLGVSRWVLASVGGPMAVAGFWIWHGLGPWLGLFLVTRDQARRGTLSCAAVLAGAVFWMLVRRAAG